MRYLYCTVFIASILSASNPEDSQEDFLLDEPSQEVALLSRKDTIPTEVTTATDPYFEGYVQALVDMHYAEYRVVVLVKAKKVWLANLPNNKMLANSIVEFVKDIPGVEQVSVLKGVPPKDIEMREKYVNRPRISGIWFPQMTELFQPLVADPRVVTYTLGWRSGDRVCGHKCVNVSLGDDFPIYRWLDVCGVADVQVGIEAGIWSVFNMDPHPNYADGWAELVNTDFYAGIPITFAWDQWSFRLRGYHISGHLGDEYMIDHPDVVRLNPSIECVDFYISYQATEAIRVYVGPGVYVHSDPTFKWQPINLQYGTEARFLSSKFNKQKLYGNCFIGLHWRNLQQLNYNFDGTYRFGYEFSKLQGIGRKFRLYVEFHHGYSLEGQFAKERTHYMQYNLNYGF
jgi:hypothetical protein